MACEYNILRRTHVL